MDSKYNKIKKMLEDDNQALPPELGWENMEAGILNKMKELQSQPVRPSAPHWDRYILAGIIIIMLMLALVCSRQTGKPIAVGGSSARLAMPEQAVSDRAVATQSENIVQPSAAAAIMESKEGLSYQNNPESKASAKPLHPAFENEMDMPTKRAMSKEPSRLPPMSTSGLGAITGMAQPPAPVPMPEERPSSIRSDAQSAIKDTTREAFTPINRLPSSISQVNTTAGFSIVPVELPAVHESDEIIQPEKKRSSGSVSMVGGLTFWNPGYGSMKPERHAYEQSLVSQNAALRYTHTFERDFIFMIGLQYQRLESQFDWSKTIDDYKIVLTDTIVEFHNNSLTGQLTPVYGDVELSVKARRVVRHYNTTQIIQIPVAIGKTWAFKNWQTDVLVGGATNVWTQNEGITVVDGALQQYDGPNPGFMSPQWNLQALLSGRVTYLLNDHFGLTTGVQFQKSLTNWSTENDIQMRPNTLNVEIGLRYYLR